MLVPNNVKFIRKFIVAEFYNQCKEKTVQFTVWEIEVHGRIKYAYEVQNGRTLGHYFNTINLAIMNIIEGWGKCKDFKTLPFEY